MPCRPSFAAWTLLLTLAACRAETSVTVPVTDGAVVAPYASPAAYVDRIAKLGGRYLLVPWTDPTTSLTPLRAAADEGVEVIVGLGTVRTFEDEWNTPASPPSKLSAALERALVLGPSLAGVHLDHAAPGLPEDGLAAYLDSTIPEIRQATKAPISFAVRARTLTVDQLQAAGFPAPPPGTKLSDLDSPQAAVAWATAWAAVLGGRVDRVVVHTENAARDDLTTITDDLDLLTHALAGKADVWATVEPFSAVSSTTAPGITRARPARSRDDVAAELAVLRSHAKVVLVEGADAFAPAALLAPDQATRPVRIDVADAELEARAERANARLRQCCLRDGQVVTVYDHRFERDHGDNVWQEDACWLTGLYTSALSFRAAVLGTADARAEARAAWRALHQLAHTTPLDGEVVRNYARTMYGAQTVLPPGSTTNKYWRRARDRELYWVGDISVDQLSGWFHGVATYYDLAATEAERTTIAADVRAVLDLFLANDLHAVEFDGHRTTYGDLRAQPVLALAFFQIGHHITGDAKYRTEYERLLDEEGAAFAIGNVLAAYQMVGQHGSDHFYASGFYPLVMYETDPARRRALELGLDIFSAAERPLGNAYADVVYGVFHPDADTWRRAARELDRYRPELTENAEWLADHAAYSTDAFVPITDRPAAELDFDYVPKKSGHLRGGLEHRFSGVGYLVSYWMARYHGLLSPVE